MLSFNSGTAISLSNGIASPLLSLITGTNTIQLSVTAESGDESIYEVKAIRDFAPVAPVLSGINNGTTYSNAVTATFTVTQAVTIYYTLTSNANGAAAAPADPTTNSTQYTGPFILNGIQNSNVNYRVKAAAFNSTGERSTVITVLNCNIDRQSPYVYNISPGVGAANVELSTNIRLYFNESLDTAYIPTVSVVTNNGSRVTYTHGVNATISFSSLSYLNDILVITPYTSLAPYTVYSNIIVTGHRDMYNNTNQALFPNSYMHTRKLKIKLYGSIRYWEDGTFEKSASNYLYPAESHKAYWGDTNDGLYRIKPSASDAPFDTYCDMTGGGWTLVLLNSPYATPVTPTWNEAVNTVTVKGILSNNLNTFDMFVGLKYWMMIGSSLRLDIGSSQTTLAHRNTYNYTLNAGNSYAISLANEAILINTGGTAQPGLYTYHNGLKFSTRDTDNDSYAGSCSTTFGNTAWWYGACMTGSFWGGGTSGGSDLNAPYWSGSAGTGEYFAWGAMWIK